MMIPKPYPLYRATSTTIITSILLIATIQMTIVQHELSYYIVIKTYRRIDFIQLLLSFQCNIHTYLTRYHVIGIIFVPNSLDRRAADLLFHTVIPLPESKKFRTCILISPCIAVLCFATLAFLCNTCYMATSLFVFRTSYTRQPPAYRPLCNLS